MCNGLPKATENELERNMQNGMESVFLHIQYTIVDSILFSIPNATPIYYSSSHLIFHYFVLGGWLRATMKRVGVTVSVSTPAPSYPTSDRIWGVPKIRGTILGCQIVRTIIPKP